MRATQERKEAEQVPSGASSPSSLVVGALKGAQAETLGVWEEEGEDVETTELPGVQEKGDVPRMEAGLAPRMPKCQSSAGVRCRARR